MRIVQHMHVIQKARELGFHQGTYNECMAQLTAGFVTEEGKRRANFNSRTLALTLAAHARARVCAGLLVRVP